MLLTYSRIFVGPLIFIFSIFFDFYFACFILFILAALTDYLDGWLARKYDVESTLGKLLDPIADKILLCCALVSIIILSENNFISFIGVIILLREFWISALREMSASKPELASLTSVTFLAKIKTALQFFALASFYISFAHNNSLGIFISSFLLFLSALISLKSGLEYTQKVFSAME